MARISTHFVTTVQAPACLRPKDGAGSGWAVVSASLGRHEFCAPEALAFHAPGVRLYRLTRECSDAPRGVQVFNVNFCVSPRCGTTFGL